MNTMPEQDWHTLRHELLVDVAELPRVHDPLLREFLGALTQAFDRLVPPYAIYRRLARFKSGQWPLLRNLIDSDLPLDELQSSGVLARATRLLAVAHEKHGEAHVEALEVELEVLRKLLERHSS